MLHCLLSKTVHDILFEVVADVVVLAAMLTLVHYLGTRVTRAVVATSWAIARR